jgi:hypothetical protein
MNIIRFYRLRKASFLLNLFQIILQHVMRNDVQKCRIHFMNAVEALFPDH